MEISRLISKASWFITAVGSIHLGVAYFWSEYNMMSYVPEQFVPVVYGLYLVAGLYSFVMLFMHCGSCCE
jgi:hypothetical protein